MQNLEVRTLQSESMGSQSVAKHEEPALNNVITCLYGTASLTSSDILHIIDMHLYRYTFHGGTCSFHVFAHSKRHVFKLETWPQIQSSMPLADFLWGSDRSRSRGCCLQSLDSNRNTLKQHVIATLPASQVWFELIFLGLHQCSNIYISNIRMQCHLR